MPRTSRLTAAASTVLVAVLALPVAAAEDDIQRMEAPEIGLAAAFPEDWTVRAPLSPRESRYDVSPDDDTPIYAWTGVFATGSDRRWCGIDRFEDFPWTLDEHATFLEQWHVSATLDGRSGGYEALALPAGPAWRIDIINERKERRSTLFLLEFGDDHILLTCSDALGSAEDWLAIAESIELGPRTADAPAAIATTLDAIHAD